MTMLEKVAKALYAHNSSLSNISSPSWDDAKVIVFNFESYWIEAARAALNAMREISPSMYDRYRCDKQWKDLNSIEVWNLWIDTALDEPPPS